MHIWDLGGHFGKKAPSNDSSHDTACLPQKFLFPIKYWLKPARPFCNLLQTG